VTSPIDFYFDFASTYGYLASERIDTMAEKYGRQVLWHPILMGAAFRATGAAPLPAVPLKGDYALRDAARSARFMGVPFHQPSNFPLPTQNAARAFLWLSDHNQDQAKAFAHACYRAYFVDDRKISELDLVLDLAAAQGADRDTLATVLVGTEIKERLKAEVELALARGVFGSPFVIVDGEPFWGVDRLPHLEHWLATGGF